MGVWDSDAGGLKATARMCFLVGCSCGQLGLILQERSETSQMLHLKIIHPPPSFISQGYSTAVNFQDLGLSGGARLRAGDSLAVPIPHVE